MKKLRPLGGITEDLEPLLFELVDQHKIQKGELLALISIWVDIHYPDAIETYEDGSHPVLKYGPKED